MRHYVRARELKAAGMDWAEVLAAQAEYPRARLAAELLASAAYDGSTATLAEDEANVVPVLIAVAKPWVAPG